MNTSQKIALTAVSLFALSYLLPAYGALRGFSCFHVCWDTMCHLDTRNLGEWFYYSGFVFSNVMFPLLVVTLFVSKRGWRLRSITSFIILLHTTSWSVLQLWDKEIKIGYYVWLAAHALLFIAHLFKAPNNSLEPTVTRLAFIIASAGAGLAAFFSFRSFTQPLEVALIW